MKVLLVDFYDSFTFVIADYIKALNVDLEVVKDKEIKLEELDTFDTIVFSPGPGLPQETRSLNPILLKYARSKKILGICLGMQGIGQHFGATLYNLEKVMHGKAIEINLLNKNWLFEGLPDNINVGLYHSWAISIPEASDLEVTAVTKSGIIMAVEHKAFKIAAVQFHPESVMTEGGKEIIKNFILG